jgi:regulator of replication initiation timing
LKWYPAHNSPVINTFYPLQFQIEAIDEAKNLREEIEKLTKEIEQLKNSRCADLEELVYLKWINACLRYELRDHHPDHGKTLARDLSMTISPSSRQKAKQLIQDYACDSGPTFLDDSNWEHSSDSSGDSSKLSNSNKVKLLGKLKNLVFGKDQKRIQRVEDSPRFSFWGSSSSGMTEELALPFHLQRPLDEQDKLARSKSDAGLGYRRKDIVPIKEGFAGNSYDGTEIPEKTHLKKLAAALEEDPRKNINRRAASFSYTTFNSFAVE